AATAWPRSALVMIAAAVRKQQPGFRTRTVLIAAAPCCSQSARKSVKKACEKRLRTPAGRPPPPGLKGIASTPQIECARLPRRPPHRLKNPAEPGGCLSERRTFFLSRFATPGAHSMKSQPDWLFPFASSKQSECQDIPADARRCRDRSSRVLHD